MSQLRAYYLWNGGSPHDLDDIQYEDAVTMWKLYELGMVGPMTQYIPAYNTYSMLHSLTGSKKKPEKFKNVFANQIAVMSLRDPTIKPDMAMQAALQLNMPEHIRKKLTGT